MTASVAILFRGPIRTEVERVLGRIRAMREEVEAWGARARVFVAAWNTPFPELERFAFSPLIDDLLLLRPPADEEVTAILPRPHLGSGVSARNAFFQYYQSRLALRHIVDTGTFDFIVHTRPDIDVSLGEEIDHWFRPGVYVTSHARDAGHLFTNDQFSVAPPELMLQAWDYGTLDQLSSHFDSAHIPEDVLQMIMTASGLRAYTANAHIALDVTRKPIPVALALTTNPATDATTSMRTPDEARPQNAEKQDREPLHRPPRSEEEIAELRNHIAQATPWFHTLDFGDGVFSPGVTPLAVQAANADVYLSDVEGKSVLDVGCWDGFYSFEALKRGARHVLATDCFVWSNPGGMGRGNIAAFKLAAKELNPRGLEFQVLDVDQISRDTVGGSFDVVLFTGVFYHIYDPLHTLKRLSELCNQTLVVETLLDMGNVPRPSMVFYAGENMSGAQRTRGWGPNLRLLFDLMQSFGFATVEFIPTPGSGGARAIIKAHKPGVRVDSEHKLSRDNINLSQRLGRVA